MSLVSFGRGSGYLDVVTFKSRTLAGKELLKGENIGEGVVSPDETEIAFELRRKTGRSLSTPSEGVA